MIQAYHQKKIKYKVMRYGQFYLHRLDTPPFDTEKIKQTKKEKKEIPEKRLNKPSNIEFTNKISMAAKSTGFDLKWRNCILKRQIKTTNNRSTAKNPFSNQDCSQRLWAL